MKKRLTYEAPEGELILVQFEENLLGDSITGSGDNKRNLNFNESGGAGNDPYTYDGGSF